jgi:rhomboid family GlyGly-CTERM serine protease
MAACDPGPNVTTRLSIPRDANWLTAAALAAALVALTSAGPEALAWLRYERATVLDGQLWRLFSAHLVHADAAHLAWNLAGGALVWWLFAREFTRRGWCLVMVASTAAIDLGFLLFEPQVGWYVGFSGVLHGCMAAGLAAWLRRARDPLTVAVAIVFAGKLVWEHLEGPLPFTSATLSLPVVVEAHSYGAVGGLIAALALLRREPAGGASL